MFIYCLEFMTIVVVDAFLRVHSMKAHGFSMKRQFKGNQGSVVGGSGHKKLQNEPRQFAQLLGIILGIEEVVRNGRLPQKRTIKRGVLRWAGHQQLFQSL